VADEAMSFETTVATSVMDLPGRSLAEMTVGTTGRPQRE
jgi:hypothetical protein